MPPINLILTFSLSELSTSSSDTHPSGEQLTEEEVLAEERRPDQLAILWFDLASGRVEPEELNM
jgi:hypothetical protein